MENLKSGDKLAIIRTRLANERTFLAYFRTGIFFLATGLSILHIDFFNDIAYLGWSFIIISPSIIGVGIFRLYYTKKNIQKIYMDC